jgi:hypothetical protein
MHSQPLFIIGAPRSGTTFLCHTLNQHACIHLTNESRIFVLLKDLVENKKKSAGLIGRDFYGPFIDFLYRNAGDLVERFYREGLGISASIWGDKHPPYADPCVLSGRTGSEPRTPQSGSCLRLIRDSLPTAKFIHIHRDPVEVAHSLLHKGWTPSFAGGISVWHQYVTEIVEFLGELDPARHLTIAYRDLLEMPAATCARFGRFLGLEEWAAIEEFLLRQRQRPTPFSDPVTDLREIYRSRKDRNGDARASALAGETAAQLGYYTESPIGLK